MIIMPPLTKTERMIRLLEAMGYTRVQSRNNSYKKFSAPDKPNIWLGANQSMKTGETLGTAINLKLALPRLFKRYNI